MTITELGALGEFVGAIAVLITLIYFSIQIRQNTQVARNNAVQSATADAVDLSMGVVDTNYMPGLSF